MDLSRVDLTNLALAVSAAADASYRDDRLHVAATQHSLAARLWAEIGYDKTAREHSVLADKIRNEFIALAATGEEVG